MNILVPISLGELYDKISILEIKLENINDPIKRENVWKEFKELDNIEKIKIDGSLFNSLKNINKILWDIENKIREKEKLQEFDNEFIELARNVYITNDQRSYIKKKINLQYNSNLIEEKSY